MCENKDEVKKIVEGTLHTCQTLGDIALGNASCERYNQIGDIKYDGRDESKRNY